MTESNGGPRTDPAGRAEPAKDESERAVDAAAGAGKRGKPSSGAKDAAGTGSADPAAIDMDSAHERAS